MNTKFCTSCQCDRDIEGMVKRRSRRTARWICEACIQRKTESIYKNKTGQTADVGKLMAKLYARSAR